MYINEFVVNVTPYYAHAMLSHADGMQFTKYKYADKIRPARTTHLLKNWYTHSKRWMLYMYESINGMKETCAGALWCALIHLRSCARTIPHHIFSIHTVGIARCDMLCCCAWAWSLEFHFYYYLCDCSTGTGIKMWKLVCF